MQIETLDNDHTLFTLLGYGLSILLGELLTRSDGEITRDKCSLNVMDRFLESATETMYRPIFHYYFFLINFIRIPAVYAKNHIVM